MEDSAQNQIIKLATLKLEPYKTIIIKLMKIEEEGIVSEMDYRELCDFFKWQILLYLKKDRAKLIADNLISIGRYVGLGNENLRFCEELRTPSLGIINTLIDDMGFGGELDETIIKDLEKAEDEYFPRLFRQAIKESFDNVLVNYCDHDILRRGVYKKRDDAEYLVFPFLNNHPRGCKIIIGPFTSKSNTPILFQLFVPRYAQKALLSLSGGGEDLCSFMRIMIDEREMPLSISFPQRDSSQIVLQMEDSFNNTIYSFSFDDRDSIARYRHNYVEIAFALSQRVKFIFLNAIVLPDGEHLYEYIAQLEKIDGGQYDPDYFSDLDYEEDIVC